MHTHIVPHRDTDTHDIHTLIITALASRVAAGADRVARAHARTLGILLHAPTLAHTQLTGNLRHSHAILSTGCLPHRRAHRRSAEILSSARTHTGSVWEAQLPCTHRALPGTHPTPPATLSCHQLPPSHLLLTPSACVPLSTEVGGLGGGACRHMESRTCTCAYHVDAHKMVALATAT